ncbi:Basic-leucine zipper domain [Macleaya cordata]|uniref:Basic-leucine zipper domain n=1 Tax=Macleaya cordata TaxID=56857 RepID=A0A200R211_MACCD|nr:Basic-leucine zipper domain [Macleaya cordata]
MSKRALPMAQNMSSGSEGDPQYMVMDDRKKRRMLSNRESARRSRMRKQQHLDDLINQVAQLQKENNEIVKSVNNTTELYIKVESENRILRAQMTELSDRLQSLNSVLRIIEEISGFPMDIPEIPDPLLKPWQLPCPSQPIMANMFQC